MKSLKISKSVWIVVVVLAVILGLWFAYMRAEKAPETIIDHGEEPGLEEPILPAEDQNVFPEEANGSPSVEGDLQGIDANGIGGELDNLDNLGE